MIVICSSNSLVSAFHTFVPYFASVSVQCTMYIKETELRHLFTTATYLGTIVSLWAKRCGLIHCSRRKCCRLVQRPAFRRTHTHITLTHICSKRQWIRRFWQTVRTTRHIFFANSALRIIVISSFELIWRQRWQHLKHKFGHVILIWFLVLWQFE